MFDTEVAWISFSRYRIMFYGIMGVKKKKKNEQTFESLTYQWSMFRDVVRRFLTAIFLRDLAVPASLTRQESDRTVKAAPPPSPPSPV